MELKNIRVFVCVPGVGKTYLQKMDNRFVDMDAKRALYKYGETDDSGLEKSKGNRGATVNKDYNEYMLKEFRRYLKETDKILLFAPNPQMVQMIIDENVPYWLVYHSLDCVEEYKQRMRDRGNLENFIESMLGDEIIKQFHKENVSDTRPAYKIELKQKQYLSDVIFDILK